MDDVFLSYKVMLILTVMFHPKGCYRKLAFLCSLVYFIIGNIKLYWFSYDNTWYLWQTVSELAIILCVIMYTSGFARLVILLTLILLVGLNLHQYLGWYKGDIFYDSFLYTSDYIYWNKWGFEVILLMLWMKEEVFSAIRARWTVNNVIMVYVIGWIVYLAGNY